ASGAFAEKNQGNISFAATTQIGSQQVPAGDYKVQWDGAGSSVQVKFLQKGKGVATSSANVVTQKTSPFGRQAVLRAEDSGVNTLQEIDFVKGKVSLVFADNMASGQ